MSAMPLSVAAINTAGLLASELKAPLRALRGLAHMLQARPGVGEVERDLVDGIILQSEALLSGIDQLGNVLTSPATETEIPKFFGTRDEKGKRRALPPVLAQDSEPINTAVCQVQVALEQLLDAAQSFANSKSIQISWDPPTKLPCVRGSRVSVMAVLSTVLDSAVEVAPTGSLVEVIALEREGMVIVEVKDEGAGIQLASDGLSLASSQIDAMGGQLIINHPLSRTGEGRRYGTQVQMCFACL